MIYLVGIMGAGKTTVGIALASLLGCRFIYLDREIEERSGRAIREIFAAEGEPRFRAIESAELERVSRGEAAVIALGGGAFCADPNRAVIRERGVSVWPDTPLGVILERCPRDGSRPLLRDPDEMERLLARRIPFYRTADLRIENGTLRPEEIAGLTVTALEARRACENGINPCGTTSR